MGINYTISCIIKQCFPSSSFVWQKSIFYSGVFFRSPTVIFQKCSLKDFVKWLRFLPQPYRQQLSHRCYLYSTGHRLLRGDGSEATSLVRDCSPWQSRKEWDRTFVGIKECWKPWDASGSSVPLGQFSSTETMRAADKSVATCLILSPLRLTFLQNPLKASVPLLSPTCITLSLSRSTTMVLYTCPFLTANSSMPMFSTPSSEVGL